MQLHMVLKKMCPVVVDSGGCKASDSGFAAESITYL